MINIGLDISTIENFLCLDRNDNANKFNYN
jgi:hypothetical protein